MTKYLVSIIYRDGSKQLINCKSIKIDHSADDVIIISAEGGIMFTTSMNILSIMIKGIRGIR